MKPSYLQTLCLAFIMTSTPVLANTEMVETVWETASKKLAAYGKLPSRITISEEIFNANQDLEEKTVIEARLLKTQENNIRFVVTNGYVNDVPIPRTHLKELDDFLSKEDEGPLIPFRPQDQPNLTWNALIEFDDIDHMACQAYSFSGIINNEFYTGKVWFVRSSGLPIQVHWKNNSVPFREDEVIIHTQHQVDYYKITDNGSSIPVVSEMNSQIEVDSIHSPSLKGRVRSVFTFQDYRPRAELQ